MEPIDFVKQQVYELGKEFPFEMFTYYYQSGTLTHIIEVASSEFFNNDADFPKYEKEFYLKFNSLFPSDFLLIQEKNNISSKQGEEILRVNSSIWNFLEQFSNRTRVNQNLNFKKLSNIRKSIRDVSDFSEPVKVSDSKIHYSDNQWKTEISNIFFAFKSSTKDSIAAGNTEYAMAA